MTDEKRTYRMRRRAQQQEETRRRITESAVALHGTIGPARTTISALAEHAGVRRSTIYRHFPDEAAIFEACSAHWMAANPIPDLGAWGAIADPDERLRTALGDLYAYYRSTHGMLEALLRDEATVPVVRERMTGFHAWMEEVRRTLAAGRGARGHAARRTRAALGHVLAFATWRSLAVEQGLSDGEAVALAAGLVDAAARGGRRGSG